jgi:hypothetical protein
LADTLKYQSIAHSVITPDDFELRDVSASKYIEAIGGYPSFPFSDSSADFWDEFLQVVEIQEDRRVGGSSPPPTDLMMLPDIWNGKTLNQVADAVHDEYPASHHVELLKTFYGQGLQIDYDILPFRSRTDFVGLQVRMADLLTWAFAVVVSA